VANNLTLVELGRHAQSRQSLVFGDPEVIIPCPEGYSLAAFRPGQTLGYERWKSNEFGTTSWQFFVIRTGGSGRLNAVPGIHPAAHILFRTRGKDATQRALRWVRKLSKSGKTCPAMLSETAWRRVGNARVIREDYPAPEHLFRAEKIS